MSWTLRCCGKHAGCHPSVYTREVPTLPDGEPDVSKLAPPWRQFTYFSAYSQRELQAYACSDHCENEYRTKYELSTRPLIPFDDIS